MSAGTKDDRAHPEVLADYERAGQIPPEWSRLYEQALARTFQDQRPKPRWPEVIDRLIDRVLLVGLLLGLAREAIDYRRSSPGRRP